MKSCVNCKYFESRTRFCRLNPPTPMFDNNSIRARWPTISRPDTDYCDSFTANENMPINNIHDNTLPPNMTLIKG